MLEEHAYRFWVYLDVPNWTISAVARATSGSWLRIQVIKALSPQRHNRQLLTSLTIIFTVNRAHLHLAIVDSTRSASSLIYLIPTNSTFVITHHESSLCYSSTADLLSSCFGSAAARRARRDLQQRQLLPRCKFWVRWTMPVITC